MNKLRVLVVDDDMEIRAALRRELSLCDLRCDLAADAEQALILLRETEFDVVVSDFDMPGMNGLDLLQRVRLTHPASYRVLLTGRADLGVAVRALNEGAVHRFLLKPWDRVDLAGIIQIGLRGRQAANDSMEREVL